MGVCGSGKTTIGEALAARLGWPFLDADAFHPPANVEKMREGRALDDDDRKPWLDRLVEVLSSHLADRGAVLACSALKGRYRDRLREAGPAGAVQFVYLAGDFDTIAARLAARQHHYMPASLLESQFAALEVPADALQVDIRMSVDEQVASIVDVLVPGAEGAVA